MRHPLRTFTGLAILFALPLRAVPAPPADPVYLIQNDSPAPTEKVHSWIMEYDADGNAKMVVETPPLIGRPAMIRNGELAFLSRNHGLSLFTISGKIFTPRTFRLKPGDLIPREPVASALDTKRNRILVLDRESKGALAVFVVSIGEGDSARVEKQGPGALGRLEKAGGIVYDETSDAFYALGKERGSRTSVYRLSPELRKLKRMFTVGDKIGSDSDGIKLASEPLLANGGPGQLWLYQAEYGHGREILVYELNPKSGPERLHTEIAETSPTPNAPAVARPAAAPTRDFPLSPGATLLSLEKNRCYQRGNLLLMRREKYANTIIVSAHGAAAAAPQLRLVLPKTKRPLELFLLGNKHWQLVNPGKTTISRIGTRPEEGNVVVRGEGNASRAQIQPFVKEAYECLSVNPQDPKTFARLKNFGPALAYIETDSAEEISLPPIESPGEEPNPDDVWKLPDHPGPSFACKKANTAAEKAICQDELLSLLDSAMAEAFQSRIAATPAGEKAALLQRQQAWLRSRDECSAINCYMLRISARYHELLGADPKKDEQKTRTDASPPLLRDIAESAKSYQGPWSLPPLTGSDLNCMGYYGEYACHAKTQGCHSLPGGGGPCCASIDLWAETTYDMKMQVSDARLATLETACGEYENKKIPKRPALDFGR